MTDVTVADLLAKASSEIEFLDVDQCRKLLNDSGVLFVDVREAEELASGVIPSAVHVPRGLLEFRLCVESPMHDDQLTDGRRLVFVCASGGRAALATQTALNFGLEAVCMQGGMKAWKESE